MANRTVLGAAALVVSAYAANDYINDRQAQQELKDRRQQQQDLRDAHAKRQEQAAWKKQKSKKNDVGDDVIDQVFIQAVLSKVDLILQAMLLEMSEKVEMRRSQNPSCSSDSNSNSNSKKRNKKKLNLPLLSNECTNEDVMLAAAFALGDADLVEGALLQYPSHKIGIGLTKISPHDMKEISTLLRSAANFSSCYYLLDMDILNAVVGFAKEGLNSSEFRVMPIIQKKRSYSIALKLVELTDAVGIHATAEKQFRLKLNAPKHKKAKCKFTYLGGTKAANGNKIRHNGAMAILDSEMIYLSNFRCNFTTSVEPTQSTHYIPDFVDINVHEGADKQRRREPDLDAMTSIYANRIANDIMLKAAERLDHLRSMYEERLQRVKNTGMHTSKGISLDHICVYSGCDVEILETIMSSDLHMISKNMKNIQSTLHSSLKAIVPSLDRELNTTLSKKEVDNEISAFVTNYLRYVTLSYCEVAVLDGKAPSKFVPNSSVQHEIFDNSIIRRPNQILVLGQRRYLSKMEHDRIVRSREVASPKPANVVLIAIVAWLCMSWLCYVAASRTIGSIQYWTPHFIQSLIVRFLLSQFLTMHTLKSVLQKLKIPLGLNGEKSKDMRNWEILQCCVSSIEHFIALQYGWHTPFDREMKFLQASCQSQYRTWERRIAMNDFHQALKRKRITRQDCFLLLTELAYKHEEYDRNEKIVGIIPGTKEEAEEFLNLEIEEEESDPSMHEKCDKTLAEVFQDISGDVEGHVQFEIGARVQIASDDIEICMAQHYCGNTEEGATTTMATHGCKTGSVATCTALYCFIHFDGDSSVTPIPFPIADVVRLDEYDNGKDISPTFATYEDEDKNETADSSVKDAVVEEREYSDERVPRQKRKVQTVEDALREGGWEIIRSKKHIKYRRKVKLSEGDVHKQTLTLPKTPSDFRSTLNTLALIRRLDERVSSGSVLFRCKYCEENLEESDFSRNQLKKASGNRRCKNCT